MSGQTIEKDAAKIITDSISSLLNEQPRVVFGIVGGRSVAAVFKNLKEKDIPWSKIHIFMIDERMVPLDSPDSNYKQAKEVLGLENIHPFRFEKGISAYEEELKRYGGGFDIALLSAGEDGHVAGLFPNQSVLDDSEYFVEFHDSPKPPLDRMSASRKLLQRSKIALLMFMGEGKRVAFEKFNDPAVDYKNCPAKLVQSISQSFVFTDLK
ncbi:MAG: 6-phosphogluconolactonase [Candidatus Saganbacteria bacterium]|nr:6-phosphogluconolactonase [Candidatus Saganbacteria bacterium]